MRTTIATKLTAATMIPCLILYAMGCYSYEAVDLMDAEQTEDLLVGTRDGRCFRLATWTSDSLGNIAGEGDEYASIDDAEGWREPRPFEGTISADSVAVLQAGQFEVGSVFLVVGIVCLVVGIGAFLIFVRGCNEDWEDLGDM